MTKKLFSGDLIPLGSFELTGRVMRVSDPCYDRGVWCCGTVDNCRPGTWEAAVLQRDMGDWGVRNAVLAARCADGGPKFSAVNRALCNATGEWRECDIDVGVDSGQAGFFDDRYYGGVRAEAETTGTGSGPDRQWYGLCCDATKSECFAGVIPYGAVSRSGFGDGGYTAYRHLAGDGTVDFLFVVFIGPEE